MALRTALLCAVSAAAGIGVSAAVFGAANGAHHQATPPPKPMTLDALAAMPIEPIADIDWAPIESGTARNAETTLFEGENVMVVWDAGPAKLRLDEPLGYDEFVVVLKGSLTLTDREGNAQTYTKGDMFMLQKEFQGTWDMTEEYRELIIVDTDAYNEE